MDRMQGVSPKKAQSAMEYLMTYGWAILVIAIVLAALFSLGVFSPSSITTSACIPSSGYLCTDPVLAPNGILVVNIGTISGPITVSGISCMGNSAFPSSFQKANIRLQGGSTAFVSFKCPVASSSVGTGFSGVLWIEYTGQSQYANSITVQLGLINAKVS